MSIGDERWSPKFWLLGPRPYKSPDYGVVDSIKTLSILSLVITQNLVTVGQWHGRPKNWQRWARPLGWGVADPLKTRPAIPMGCKF